MWLCPIGGKLSKCSTMACFAVFTRPWREAGSTAKAAPSTIRTPRAAIAVSIFGLLVAGLQKKNARRAVQD